MDVIDVSTFTHHRVRIDVADTGDLMAPDYRKGEFRPAAVRIEWQSFDEGVSWRLSTVEVTGPMLKKDGTDSQNIGKRNFSMYADQVRPLWLQSLLDEHTSRLSAVTR
jgi:hypothetical protein